MNWFFSVSFISLFASVGYAAAGGMISGTINGPDGAAFKATERFDITKFEH